jgi:hypothetical protein
MPDVFQSEDLHYQSYSQQVLEDYKKITKVIIP